LSVLRPEQRERVWRVGLAALLHDVGKFAQRAEADPEQYRSLANLHEFARTDDRGITSYHHAAYTWQFIERHAGWLCRVGEESGENVAGWAARHHKPSSVWDWIVAESDRLSASMDRGEPHPDEAFKGWAGVKTARLLPLLGRVNAGDPAFHVPFAPLRLDESMFPRSGRSPDPAAAAREYQTLFGEFAEQASRIPGGSIARFFQSFMTVYERYSWCIPAATNASPRDVSLFEHSRAASAVASALTAELEALGGVTEGAVKDRNAEYYLLAVGDLSGIQRFLYTITTENAARALRGRSFFLQLLADAIADHVLRTFGLPPANALYSGGGKLWLLLPAFAQKGLAEVAERIDLQLQEDFGGRLGFSIGTALLSGAEFISAKVGRKLRDATDDLLARRRRRFARALREEYGAVFDPFGEPGADTLCHVCGKLDREIARLPEEARLACRECRDLERLGNLLTRARVVGRATGADWRGHLENCRSRLGEDPGNSWYFPFPNLEAGFLLSVREPGEVAAAAGEGVTVLGINSADIDPGGEAAVGLLLAGVNRARGESGRTLTFDEMADRSLGVSRLGVLRMDVDSLGEIFANGMAPSEVTLSRITNLSKSLAYFFGGYVSSLVERADEPWSGETQIIYSGGDDLFVVGPWSVLPALARRIRSDFARFTCENPAWGISGGLAIVRAKNPVAAAAKLAGDLEHEAKCFERLHGRRKDAFAFLGEAMEWQEADVVAALAGELLALVDTRTAAVPGFPTSVPAEKRLARGWIHRLGRIANIYRDARETVQQKDTTRPLAEVEAAVRRGTWVWTKAYALARATGDRELGSRLERLMGGLSGKSWETAGGVLNADRDLIWLLRPAAVWADLLSRERR
jgi:CRISPR-associated protein Csm1